MFKTDGTLENNYVLDTNGLHIIDNDKLQTYIQNAEPGADNFYSNLYTYLKDNYWTDKQYEAVSVDIEASEAQAKQIINEVIVSQCPNAKKIKDIQRCAAYSTNSYARLKFNEFFEAVKDNTALIDAYKADQHDETLVIDTDEKKVSFMDWYLGLFENNWKSIDTSLLDEEWYKAYRKAKLDYFKKAITDGDISLEDFNITFEYRVNKGNGGSDKSTYTKKVVGVFDRDYTINGGGSYNFYMQRSEIEEFAAKKMDLNYSRLFAAKPTNTQALTKIITLYYDSYDAFQAIDYKDKTNDDFYYSLQSPLVQSILMWVEMLAMLEKIFLYTGIGMAAFAMLLFYNFMSISINNKRHEIGVLRAVGARGVDVFKIFYSESAIIAVINFILATASLIAVGIVLNQKIGEAIPGLVLLNVGFIEILLVFAVALVASVISSILPVAKIARQKPIDAIREK